MNPTVGPDWLALRREALLLLEGRGLILETARDVSRALVEAGVEAAVIGGVAVVLHGHLRTTKDVDLFVPGPLDEAATVLAREGFALDPARREFLRDGVPIHLVTLGQVEIPPRRLVEIEGIRTVSLADLVAMKLRSGTSNLLRSQDLADVVGLARHHRLGPSFAAKLPKDVRPTFREIARALLDEELPSPDRSS